MDMVIMGSIDIFSLTIRPRGLTSDVGASHFTILVEGLSFITILHLVLFFCK